MFLGAKWAVRSSSAGHDRWMKQVMVFGSILSDIWLGLLPQIGRLRCFDASMLRCCDARSSAPKRPTKGLHVETGRRAVDTVQRTLFETKLSTAG